MRAITQSVYGGVETLQMRDMPVPVPGSGEVLVRVKAASINAADWLLMRGEPYLARLAFGIRRPKVAIRGRDVAGIIEALGPNVTGFAVGDEVYAEVDAGSFADYTIASVKRLAHKPSSLSFEQAAAVPIAGTTALQAVRDAGSVKPGDRVLINGASGGVGSFAVQIAKARGAEVTAVCSTRNLDLVREWGADHVIDYTTTDFTAGATKYDVIVDIVANHSLAAFEGALTERGTLVLCSGSGGRVLGPVGRILAASIRGMFVRRSLKPLASVANGSDLAELATLIDAGLVTPAIEARYPLEQVPEALTHFGETHARGKLVITV